MAKITIYSTTYCPYCVKAKKLLDELGQGYEEINVEVDSAKMAEMLEKSGGMRSVPQIFIGDKHIGGCDDMYTLYTQGKLEKLFV